MLRQSLLARMLPVVSLPLFPFHLRSQFPHATPYKLFISVDALPTRVGPDTRRVHVCMGGGVRVWRPTRTRRTPPPSPTTPPPPPTRLLVLPSLFSVFILILLFTRPPTLYLSVSLPQLKYAIKCMYKSATDTLSSQVGKITTDRV